MRFLFATGSRLRWPLLGLLLWPLLAACAAHEPEYTVGDSSYLLSESVVEGGGVVSYHLNVKSAGSARVDIMTARDEPHLELGVTVLEIDKARARFLKRLGVTAGAHEGLLVESVAPESAAQRAGVQNRDILLTVDGARVRFHKDLTKAMGGLQGGDAVTITLRRKAEVLELELVPAVRMRQVQDIESVALRRPKVRNPRPYMGVTLRSFPQEHVQAVFGHNRPVAVITGVALGSPAYLAGLRAGDIITRVNGQAAPGPDDLLRLIRRRGRQGEDLEVTVRNKQDEVTVNVELEDYTGVARTYLPLVWSTAVSARKTEWNILLGGWLMGYENRYVRRKTRAPEEYGHFTALLGLIRVKWAPSGSRTRLLWFIHFR